MEVKRQCWNYLNSYEIVEVNLESSLLGSQ